MLLALNIKILNIIKIILFFINFTKKYNKFKNFIKRKLFKVILQ